MRLQTVQRIVRAAACIGLAVGIATIVIAGFAWSGRSLSGAFATTTATALMIATLGLQATFLIMQMFPNGRAMVPVGRFGPDGWTYVIISTAIPSALWHELAAMAIPFMSVIMPGFITPLYTCLLLLVARVIQQRHLAVIHE